MKYKREGNLLVPVMEPDPIKPVIVEPPGHVESPEGPPGAPTGGTPLLTNPILYSTHADFFKGLPPLSSVISRYNRVLKKASDRGDLKEVVRLLGERDRYFFFIWVLGRKDGVKPFVYQMCRFLEYYGSHDKGDFWSREHYKTSLKIEAGVLQRYIQEPWRTFGIFGYTKSISSPFLFKLKTQMETNEKLKFYWDDKFYEVPEVEAPLWSVRDGLIQRGHEGRNEPTFEAHGLTKNQPTGLHLTNMIFDDIVDKESASSANMTNQTIDAWRLSLNLVDSDYIERWYEGTFYSYGDAYQHMIKIGAIEARIAPCTFDGTETGEPVLWTREQVAEKRRNYGAYTFACQCLLDPLKKSKMTFRYEWLQYWGGKNMRNLDVYVIVDPAGQKKDNSDYTAFCVFGYGPDGKARIIALMQDKLSLSERTRLVFDFKMRYNAKAVYYERYGKDSDIEHIKYVQNEKNYRFPIFELGGKLAKEDRILRMVPWFEHGRVLLPGQFLWETSTGEVVDFIDVFIKEQYTKFPFRVKEHDDLFDVVARIEDVRLHRPDYEAAEESIDDYLGDEGEESPKDMKWQDIA